MSNKEDTCLGKHDQELLRKAASLAEALSPSAFEAQLSDYGTELAEMNLSDEAAAAMIATLWRIMAAMVDLGFRVDLADPCGQIFGPFNEAAAQGDAGINSPHPNHMEMPSHGTEKDRNATC